MVLENSEECRFVADISDVLVVQIVKTATESIGATKDCDELCLVVRDKTRYC